MRPSIPGQHASHRPRPSQANRCDAAREWLARSCIAPRSARRAPSTVMVFAAFSQLGLPAPHLAVSSMESWVIVLACAIIWLALGGSRTMRPNDGTSRA